MASTMNEIITLAMTCTWGAYHGVVMTSKKKHSFSHLLETHRALPVLRAAGRSVLCAFRMTEKVVMETLDAHGNKITKVSPVTDGCRANSLTATDLERLFSIYCVALGSISET